MGVLSGKKDLISGVLHFAGMLVSIAVLTLLVAFAAVFGTPWHVVAFVVYGVSLMLLYAASSIYHVFYVSDRFRSVMRKIDHMMIFVLIAGTYTPLCLLPLRGPWGWSIFGIVWGMAVGGIVTKMFFMNAPRWLYTGFYLLMGWAAIIAVVPLSRAMPPLATFFLYLGGAFYTVGGICYALKRPRFTSEYFGFHELFHVLVLLGSISHVIMMFFVMFQG